MNKSDEDICCHMTNMTNEEEAKYYLNLIGQGIVIPSICLIGMVLNVLNFVVLLHPQLKTSSYTYLTSLAVADFFSLLLFGTNGIGQGHFPESFQWKVYERFVYFPVALTTTSASVFMILSVTIERCVFLYKPIKAKFWCTQQRARIIIVVLWAISVVMNIPRFFVFTTTADGKLTFTKFGGSIFYQVLSWLYFLVFSVGCGIVLVVFNIMLIRGIKETNERRKSMQNTKNLKDKNEELRLTRMLISVIFLYVVGELPSCVFSRMVFAKILGDSHSAVMNELWYKICLCIATIFVVLQHSLNFVFYCVFNKRFYQIFKQKFHSRCGQELEADTLEMTAITHEQTLLNNDDSKETEQNGTTNNVNNESN